MVKLNKSKIMAAVHEMAEDLHEARVMPTQTLRKFDALCLKLVQERLDTPKPPDKTRSGTISA